MIDRIIEWDENGYSIHMSDLYPYENYIGFEDEDGNIYYY